MGIPGYILGSLTNPAPTIRNIKKSVSFSAGVLVLLVGLVVVSLLSAAGDVWTTGSADTGKVFFDGFLSYFGTGLFIFIAIVLVVHCFMRALEQKGNIQKFTATLAFPYISISILLVILGLLKVGIGKLGSMYGIGTYLLGGMTFILYVAEFYGYILYILSTRENYNSSLAMATMITLVAVILSAMLATIIPLLSLIGGGLTV